MKQTIRQVLGYLGGGLLLLLGVLLLFGAPPAGVVVIGLGLFVLPPVRQRYSIKTTTVGLVIWGVSLLLLLFGTIVAVQLPVAGILAIAAGLVALPPLRRQFTKRSPVQPHGAVLAVVVLVGAVASMGLVYLDMNEPPERNNVTHSLGEPFTVNGTDDRQLQFNVTGAQRVETVNSSNMETPVKPAYDTYLVVFVEIENIGDDEMDLSDGEISVIGRSETDSYSASPDAQYLRLSERVPAGTEVLDIYNNDVEIEPGERMERAIVYDVRGDRSYQLKVTPTSTSAEGDYHYVPLSNILSSDESENPETES